MEIINTNTLPGDNARSCSTDALLPPHIGGEGTCNHCSYLDIGDICKGNFPND